MSASRFCIVSAQRSGSTYLMDLLDSSADITCAGELFKLKDSGQIRHPSYSFRYDIRHSQFLFKWRRKRLLEHHLRLLDEIPGVFGFKLMISQIDAQPEIEGLISSHGHRFIVLIRKDMAAQVLSLEYARVRSKWVNQDGQQGQDVVLLDLDRLKQSCAYFKRCRKELTDLAKRRDALQVSYEDLVGEHARDTWRTIRGFIGLDEVEIPSSSLQRTTERPYSQLISNYTEVQEVLRQEGLVTDHLS